MWRFFCGHKTASIPELSDASMAAWAACWRVYDAMTESDRVIIDRYYGAKYDRNRWNASDMIAEIASDMRASIDLVQTALDRAVMMVAVERGLADEPVGYNEHGFMTPQQERAYSGDAVIGQTDSEGR